jgi:hypothetical protein
MGWAILFFNRRTLSPLRRGSFHWILALPAVAASAERLRRFRVVRMAPAATPRCRPVGEALARYLHDGLGRVPSHQLERSISPVRPGGAFVWAALFAAAALRRRRQWASGISSPPRAVANPHCPSALQSIDDRRCPKRAAHLLRGSEEEAATHVPRGCPVALNAAPGAMAAATLPKIG